MVKAAPPQLRYEDQLTVAEGDYVILYGRFSGRGGGPNWIVADVVRVENGILTDTGT